MPRLLKEELRLALKGELVDFTLEKAKLIMLNVACKAFLGRTVPPEAASQIIASFDSYFANTDPQRGPNDAAIASRKRVLDLLEPFKRDSLLKACFGESKSTGQLRHDPVLFDLLNAATHTMALTSYFLVFGMAEESTLSDEKLIELVLSRYPVVPCGIPFTDTEGCTCLANLRKLAKSEHFRAWGVGRPCLGQSIAMSMLRVVAAHFRFHFTVHVHQHHGEKVEGLTLVPCDSELQLRRRSAKDKTVALLIRGLESNSDPNSVQVIPDLWKDLQLEICKGQFDMAEAACLLARAMVGLRCFAPTRFHANSQLLAKASEDASQRLAQKLQQCQLDNSLTLLALAFGAVFEAVYLGRALEILQQVHSQITASDLLWCKTLLLWAILERNVPVSMDFLHWGPEPSVEALGDCYPQWVVAIFELAAARYPVVPSVGQPHRPEVADCRIADLLRQRYSLTLN